MIVLKDLPAGKRGLLVERVDARLACAPTAAITPVDGGHPAVA